MIWRLRKQVRQYFRRIRGKSEYETSLRSYGANRFLQFLFAWTLGSVTFMHILFGMRDPATGDYVMIDPRDMKYVGIPGYEVNAYGLTGKTVDTRKVKTTVDDDD